MQVMFSLNLNKIWSLEYSSRDLDCKHKKTTWVSCSYKTLANVNQNLGTKQNIGNCESLVCDVNGFQDNMCVIIHHVGGIVS